MNPIRKTESIQLLSQLKWNSRKISSTFSFQIEYCFSISIKWHKPAWYSQYDKGYLYIQHYDDILKIRENNQSVKQTNTHIYFIHKNSIWMLLNISSSRWMIQSIHLNNCQFAILFALHLPGYVSIFSIACIMPISAEIKAMSTMFANQNEHLSCTSTERNTVAWNRDFCIYHDEVIKMLLSQSKKSENE